VLGELLERLSVRADILAQGEDELP